MAATVQQSSDLTTIALAVLSSSVLTSILTFYLNKISYKNGKSLENKIVEIKVFYKSYQLYKLGIERYLFYTMHSAINSSDTKSIENDLFKLLQDFNYQCTIVKLFLNDVDYKNISIVESMLTQIKKDIDIFHVDFNYDSPADSGQRLAEISNVELKTTLPALMKNVESSLRIAFK